MVVSIIIPTFNNEKTLGKCIEGCLNQGADEIIVVDDGSKDNTADLVKHYPVRYIYQENQGPASARNTGWRLAKGDIICFIDADCVPERDWAKNLLSRFTSDDITGVGGGYDIINRNSILARCIHEEIVERHRKICQHTDFLGSFNVCYRRDVLEKAGGFDEGFKHASGEDNDLAYKIKKMGYRLIFDSDIKVGHHHPERLWKYLKSQFWHGYWRVKLYKIHLDMAGGDSYAGLSDFIQPPIAVGILGCGIFSLFIPGFWYLGGCLSLLLLILEMPLILSVVKRCRDIRYFYLIIVLTMRSVARGIGLLKGISAFFILQK